MDSEVEFNWFGFDWHNKEWGINSVPKDFPAS